MSLSPTSFEIDLSPSFVGPIALDDEKLLALDRSDLTKLDSEDSGRTWNPAGRLLDKKTRGLVDGFTRAYVINLIRLRAGDLALKYEIGQRRWHHGSSPMNVAYFTRSSDEGQTWSDPVRITPSDTPTNTTWMIETSDGVLVVPNEYAYSQPGTSRREKMSICTTFFSEDGGESWEESRDGLWLNEYEGRVQGLCEVPVTAQSSDGRLLMFMRTKYQRIAESVSEDSGRTWSATRLNELVSSNAEIFLTAFPSTGDLLCIWNQASTSEIENGFYRARLTSATSSDGGATWVNFRTVASTPGLPQVRRIEPNDPPRLLATPRAVPLPDHMVAEEFHMNRAPRVEFVGDTAHVSFTHRRYRWVDGEHIREHDGIKLRVLPVGWFYQ